MIPALTFAAGILVSIFRDNDQPHPARIFAFVAALACFVAAIGLFVAGPLMTDQDNTDRPSIIAAALCVIAFIGGCTATFRSENESGQVRACVQADMEWRDGDCVRPEARQ
jgi:peptidoglycan/LPS O-acetylase OafA/YrhL